LAHYTWRAAAAERVRDGGTSAARNGQRPFGGGVAAKIFRRRRRARSVRASKRNRESVAQRRRETPRAVTKRAVAANRLALIRAFCASPRPSTRPPTLVAQNFFACARPPHVDFAACRKMRDKDDARASDSEKIKKPDVAETHVPSALSRCLDFCSQNPASEKFLAAAQLQRSRCASRAAAGRGSYAQRRLKSLLIFFCCSNPVSVPVDPRRHCTESPSTKLRRAAMAKKRKKAAAKKPAKKRRKKK
jgi:hypothetical protein